MKFLLYGIFQDPKIYVETILEVHLKYNALVLTAFNNDAGFVAALDKVMKLFLCMQMNMYSLKYMFLFWKLNPKQTNQMWHLLFPFRPVESLLTTTLLLNKDRAHPSHPSSWPDTVIPF